MFKGRFGAFGSEVFKAEALEFHGSTVRADDIEASFSNAAYAGYLKPDRAA